MKCPNLMINDGDNKIYYVLQKYIIKFDIITCKGKKN